MTFFEKKVKIMTLEEFLEFLDKAPCEFCPDEKRCIYDIESCMKELLLSEAEE